MKALKRQIPDEEKKETGPGVFFDGQNKRVCAFMGMSVGLEVEGLTLFSLL